MNKIPFLAIALLVLLAATFAHGKVLLRPDAHKFNRKVLYTRLSAPTNWYMAGDAPAAAPMKFRVALKQQNLKTLETMFWDRTNPKSKNYGKWLSQDEILKIVAPPKKHHDAVMNWLNEAGVIQAKSFGDFIKVVASVQTVEKLFATDVRMFKHSTKANKTVLAVMGSYSVPASIAPFVDMVVGISDFPTSQYNNKRMRPLSAGNDATDLAVVPLTLYNLYGIEQDNVINSASSICLAEFQDDQSYNEDDLKKFFAGNDLKDYTVSKVVGPFSGSSPDGESTLDVQYGMAIARGAQTWFWTVTGWMYEFSTDLFSAKEAPLVTSMSWGWTDWQQCSKQNGPGKCSVGENSEQYVARVNVEFQKIGLRGLTLVAASGDQGAPGDSDPYCSTKNHVLTPMFPADSPYVTAVGATMFKTATPVSKTAAGTPPVCKQSGISCAGNGTEVACSYPDALITTGGGFATYDPRPAYQADAVETYLANTAVPKPPKDFFNASNRAYPDVSAAGHNYYIYLSGQWQQVDGTSASSPVFAGVIALLNNERLNAGKPALGFVNPLLYTMADEHPEAFTDITEGNNKCNESQCCKYGYEASKGWDPVTGLGTPNVPEMIKYVASLN